MSLRPRAAVTVAVLLLLGVLAGCTSHGPKPVVATDPAWATAAPSSRPAGSGSRPNILVIEADDMRVDDLRWMPHVRRLIADTGLTFENSFAPYPLCCPSRASFLSGEYAHNHGVLDTQDPFGFRAFDDSTTIATVLHQAGYQTAIVGKYLNGYGRQDVPGTNRSSLHYKPPGWTDFYGLSDHHWYSWEDVTGGTYNYFQPTQSINHHVVTWPHKYSTSVLAEQARQLIGKYAAQGKPWFLWYTPIAPHYGNPPEADDPKPTYNNNHWLNRWPTPARPNWVKGHFDAEITHGQGVPPNHPAERNMSDKPGWMQGHPELNAKEKAAEVQLARQRAEALYVLDTQVGRTVAYLRRSHQLHDTDIFFTSDNGYYLGEHRKRQYKTTLHEPSLRVPLVATGPDIPRGRRYDPVATVDMAPTIADLAGVRTGMPRADGVDLVPMIRHGDRGWRRPIITEARMNNDTYLAATGNRHFDSQLDIRGLRLGRWKLTVYSTGEIELYDLARDPLELHSLQDDPRYAGIKRRLERLWTRYEKCAGAACSRPLPRDLQLSPAAEKRITDHEYQRTTDYYSNPGWDIAQGFARR